MRFFQWTRLALAAALLTFSVAGARASHWVSTINGVIAVSGPSGCEVAMIDAAIGFTVTVHLN